MRGFWKQVEQFFDRMIVPALLMILIIVVADIFFTDVKYSYEQYFFYADLFVIGTFVGDLSFKFKRAASWKGFLRNEWLEIIAIVPFFWIFRLVESIVRIGELVQEIIHIIARGGRLVRLAAAFKVTVDRHERFAEFIGKLFDRERFEEAVKFYKHPDEE